MVYAFQNGDPRKVYHGMDYQGNLCGVDLPYKPYVYWCQKQSGSGVAPQGLQVFENPMTGLDFHHPICVNICPFSSATQSPCFNADTGSNHLVTDYATHPVAERYCMPQSADLLAQYNLKMDAHAINKYVPIVVSIIRQGWPVLLGVFFLAFILSMTYLLVIECFAWLVIWTCLGLMVLLPGLSGSYLIYASFHGGIDGMPGSGDDGTDLALGGTLNLLLSVLELSSLCSRFLLDFLANAGSDLSEHDLVLLEVVEAVVDVSEAAGGSTAEFGLHAVNDDAVWGRLVHLSERLSDFLGGWGGVLAVADVDEHLLSVQ